MSDKDSGCKHPHPVQFSKTGQIPEQDWQEGWVRLLKVRYWCPSCGAIHAGRNWVKPTEGAKARMGVLQ